MSPKPTRLGDWPAGLAAGCDRLVHPSVNGGARARQQRLLGVLLAGPFVVAAAIVQAALPAWGAAGALAALCAVFGASWLVALRVATSGRSEIAEPIALGGAAVLAGALVALSGGMGAPAAILIAALAAEAWWVSRSCRAAAVAAVAGLGAAFALGPALGAVADPVAAHWQWLSPALWAASLALRLTMQEATDGRRRDDADPVSLPETCFDAVVARITRSGEVESASPQAAGLLRVEPELLFGSGLFDRIHVADRVAFLCAVAQTCDDGRPRGCDIRIRMPMTTEGGGGYRPFAAEIVKTGTDEETAVAIIRDGRATAALREELSRAVEQASATEVAKSRFLASVSHELRTPLNAIIGFSDMLLHREISGELPARQEEHVRLIREAGNHLLSVVNAILDVSKIEAGSYQISVEPFDLGPAVELCRAMLEPQAAAKGVSLSAKLPQGLGEVVGDQRAVQQILLNLLSNAIKFTPEGGSVSIGAARKDGVVRLFVNDTGIGISAEDLARLGRPFMQVHNDYTRQFQGTGLGLSLVKGLVKLLGGSMSIESAPGLGTTVTVGLPAADAAAGADAGGRMKGKEEKGGTGERHDIALRKIA